MNEKVSSKEHKKSKANAQIHIGQPASLVPLGTYPLCGCLYVRGVCVCVCTLASIVHFLIEFVSKS